MAMSQKQALEAAREIFNGPRAAEASRLHRIAEALKPPALAGQHRPSVQIPNDAPPIMREMARKSETNYLPMLVKTFGQVMKVEGYYSAAAEGLTDPWRFWQMSRMDSRQTGLHRSVLQYGTGYALALPGRAGDATAPATSLLSPRRLTAIYQDFEADEWPMLALHIEGDHWSLFDEENEYRFGVEDRKSIIPRSGTVEVGSRDLTFIDVQEHGLGVCPVVRYQDRNLLAGEEQMGIVEPLLAIQERIDETTYQMMVAQFFGAFRQRYVLGWMPEDESEHMKVGAGRVAYFGEKPDEIKIGEFEQTDPSPYLESLASAKRDFAAIGQVPAQSLGVDGISNISAETLAGLEAAKNRESNEITTSMGESHEQLMRLWARIAGDSEAAQDYEAEVRWRDFETRSLAQTADALGKLVTMLGLPEEIALEDIPNMTPQKMQRVRDIRQQQQGAGVLDALRARADEARADERVAGLSENRVPPTD